ncbi:LIM domain kinase 1 isoform X2 [Calliphora vicina]|uniref:LIM domain kinase 1 isoform X2 n=1 Tax=Calliphora vicina TaxID=7373 RepID=UPI00325BCB66
MSSSNTTASKLQKSSPSASNSQSLPRLTTNCAGCLNELLTSSEEECVVALGQEWHADCFRCSVCDHHLHNWYFEKDGLLFCRDDYYQRFGEACQQCSDVISGPVMVAGDHKFHPECFGCTQCSSFIGYGEAFALLERSKLYCDVCYRKLLNTETSSVDGIIKPLHSIRLVEIPKDITTSLRLSVDNIDGAPRNATAGHHLSGDNWNSYLYNNASSSSSSHLDYMSGKGLLAGSSSDLCPAIRISEIDVNLTNLHVGDRILEVNGTPISDNSIEQIDKMIRSTEILQLTVEHDPIQVCRSCSHVDIKKVTSEVSLPLATSASSVEVFGRTYDSGGSCTTTTNTSPTQPKDGSPTRLTKQDKERIYKRNDEGYISGTKTRQLRKSKNLNMIADQERASKNACINNNNNSHDKNNSTSKSFRGKERCSSMSKLMGDQHTAQTDRMYDLTRTTSFRVEQKPPRVFRPHDLVIGELLGKGFFGQVFKVTHRLTKEVMVLKELHRVEETAQLNFLKEVAVLKSLHHKNVLKFIGVLYKEKRLHLVTEYVAGGSLKELLHDSGLPLTWPERISFAKDIACGMSYLHSKNIIHRDLNSLNCLVKEDKTIIVADFGLARIINTSLSSRCSEKWNSAERSNSREGTGSANQEQTEGVSNNNNNNNNNGTLGRSKSRQRRQRYTVVGNPYWMAPEMMKGFIYDEKVDIFSFGIMLCEIIGRVQADPDFLPRTHDFGLNQKVFREKFCYQCPEPFYKIAFLCCDLNPDRRPSFEILEVWLDSLQTHIASNQPVPQELLYDIENYQGGSISSTPVDILTPKSNLSRDNLDELGNSSHSLILAGITNIEEKEAVDEQPEQTEEKVESYSLPDGIPKSPHLGKDFSPSGERIHNSMRARRRQRFLQAQNASSQQNEDDRTDQVLNAVKDSLQQDTARTSRRKVDRGFVLDISRSGVLNINNVRDLNNLSDFDSSCDTSLNYHEVNTMEEANTNDVNTNTTDPKDSCLNTIQESDDHVDGGRNKNATLNHSTPSINITAHEEEEDTQQALDSLHNVKRNLAEKSYKSALDDIRTRLNLCKTKFDTIEEANRKNYNQSQNSMKSFFKVQSTDDVYKAPPDTYKMFGTLKSTNTSANDKDDVKKTYRVNQTPVFGRKSQAAVTEIYKPHSDSLENLDKIGLSVVNSKTDKKDFLSPPKRAKLPKERTFKSYITSLEVTPTETTVEQLPTKKENSSSSGKMKVSSNLLGLRKTLNFNSPSRNEETKSFSRRTLSPTKSSEAKRVVKQETPTTSRLRSVATSPTKPLNSPSSNSTRLTILSPEKIHRLNAKLNDQKKSTKTPAATANTSKTNTNDIKNLQNSPTNNTTSHSIRGTTENERTKRNATSRSQFYTRY